MSSMRLSVAGAAMAAPASSPVEAVVFDCFGVLYTDAKRLFFEGLSPEKVTELRDIFRQIDHGFLDKETAVEAVMSISNRTPEEFDDLIRSGYQLNADLVAKIHELRPRYKVGLLSNIGRGWIDDFFDKHQIGELFDAVVLSGEEGVTKPDPRIYQAMVERLGVTAAGCIMIDDVDGNCRGAEAAGLKAIHYLSNDQCFTDLKSYGV